MKKKIAKKWAEALRSGEYEQRSGTLKAVLETPGAKGRVEYCCLGVLCEMALKEGVGMEEKKRSIPDSTCSLFLFDGESAVVPPPVQKWAGLKTDMGSMSLRTSESGPGYSSLMEYNDEGCSFSEIADVIEANAEAL